MTPESTRRTFLVSSAAGLVLASASSGGVLGPQTDGTPATDSAARPSPNPPALPDAWPTQPPEMAREMVGASHGRVERVRELLATHPSLARAAWDWGFGDWETALGAASHVGNREIAELLLARSAAPTLFSAAMLGQLATVRVFVEGSSGVLGTLGPHGLTLLHHARAGGERAKPVVDYLEKVGGADPQPALAALSEVDQAALVGTYLFGAGARDRVVVAIGRFGLTFERAGTSALRLFHLGGLEFHPPAVPGARIRFERAVDGSWSLSVRDPDLVMRAVRAPAGVG